jgi:hypothetical protein
MVPIHDGLRDHLQAIAHRDASHLVAYGEVHHRLLLEDHHD